ncbi:NYN domain-containing protein [Ethanoligenens harbinense]|uniref:NYN domain-containing protein n=1 Tax=Ethanoligenens harbinense (strain DSM 18485 / JCM 12961 / CGMCC 1.5033 / YUAN-3) TaxID=663278 RepID=E6UA59_ETHHY|nr:NYN domain-containing protein [Ethanoligenens harbinense]ADU27420.1 hypothetical protein Ethha_1898 [Ethanoligenens harbinense YUAN-3]AVQ96478.1 NYN domain-containing protein [Ethanoligenens harbinense YUAN-3]AYF39137.1 NYN domain-containing protein [Ethanoligenens harbinense]AYF41963.1 NYN domain-containing protein [Ethanoligenens harbinense]QCN92719.1 NYN domain-containing protein [Ethanoligenens harbinense]
MGKFVYVDNSNVWIEGKYYSAVKKGMVANIFDAHENKICDMPWGYDFGKLLNISCEGDENSLKRAVLYGSKPTDNDSLWNAARRFGFEVYHPERNVKNKEKRVDTGFDKEVLKDLYKSVIGHDDNIILVAGDADHVPVAEAIVEEGMKFTLVFWDNASETLKNMASKFISLNNYIAEITR